MFTSVDMSYASSNRTYKHMGIHGVLLITCDFGAQPTELVIRRAGVFISRWLNQPPETFGDQPNLMWRCPKMEMGRG